MIITIAWTDNSLYEYDLAGGLAAHPAAIITCQLEIATTNTVEPQAGSPFKKRLLDGQALELKSQYYQKQKITTLPNLLLSGFIIPPIFGNKASLISYYEILRAWHYAQSRWITTDDLFDSTAPMGLVKVVRGQENLPFEQVNNITWAVRSTFEVETAGVFGTIGS
jgi:hypothetical protein